MTNETPPTYNGLGAIASPGELQPGEVRVGNLRMFPSGDRVHIITEDAVEMARFKDEKRFKRLKLYITALVIVIIVAMFIAAFACLTIYFRSPGQHPVVSTWFDFLRK